MRKAMALLAAGPAGSREVRRWAPDVLLVGFAVLLVGAIFALPGGAQAEPPALTFDFSSPPYPTGAEDTELLLQTKQVDPEFQGLTCDVVAMAQNVDDPSIHEGNDFIIRSNGDDVVIPNFESGVGETPGFGTLVLGDEASLFLRFGADGISSGDVTVSVTCTPEGEPPIVVPPDAPRVDRPAPAPPVTPTPPVRVEAPPAPVTDAVPTLTG